MIPSYEADDFRNFFERPEPIIKDCRRCGKQFEVDSMMQHLCPIYEPEKDSLCWNCFREEIKGRKLTKKEVKELVDKRVRDEKYSSTFAPFYWWEGFTDEQKKILNEAYEKLRRKEHEDREKEILKEYYSKAKSIVMANGNDITGIVAVLLRKIDEKTSSRGEMVFR